MKTHYRDGNVVLYQRGKSGIWQCRMKIGKGKGSWKRFSTEHTDIKEASKRACNEYDRTMFRIDEGLSANTKDFFNVAQITIQEMKDEISLGLGKSIYHDYIQVINKYFIPYFGNTNIDTIDSLKVRKFDVERTKILKRVPAKSTINTHNAALRRVFNTAVENGWINENQIPSLSNRGAYRGPEPRPYFTKREYHTLYTFMSEWCVNFERSDGLGMKTKYLRELLYDYVMIIANSGMRPGTETHNLKWKHISFGYKNKRRFIKMKVSGKTGERTIVVRDNTKIFLDRIAGRFKKLKDMPDKELCQQDEYVFRLIDGTRRPKSLIRPFEKCLSECGLLYDDQGKKRTLYSLRHSYITWGLLDGVGIHLLAKQAGTSVSMIEKHYSHVIPELQADILAGWDATSG